MKISRVETFLVAPRWLFVRIETESGVVGWGEASLEGHSDAVRTAVEQFAELLVGADSARIEDHWQVLTKSGFYRGGPVLGSAVSGIDQALWDIKGKSLGVPVYELLGGAVRERIRMYGWVGGDDPSGIVDAVQAQLDVGLTAVKMNASGPMGRLGTVAEIDGVLERVAAAREVLGPHRDVAVDFHGRFTLANARRIAPLLEPLHPFFIEEPVVPENSHLIGQLAQVTSVPIATGGKALQQAGLPSGVPGRHRRRPAGPLACGRNLRGAPHRGDGRGVRRATRAALSARPDRARRLPAGGVCDTELPHPGAEHRHSL